MLGFSFSCLTAWGASCFERWCADGVGARERKEKEGKGREQKGQERKGRERKGKEGKGRERKGKEMSGEKKPLGMSELCCADGCGRRRCKAVAGNGWGEEAAGDELCCADGCGRRGCKGVAGNGLGEEAAGDERAWLRGRLRTTWVQGGGWKCVGRRSRWRSASLPARTAADGVGAREWLEMGGGKNRWG